MKTIGRMKWWIAGLLALAILGILAFPAMAANQTVIAKTSSISQAKGFLVTLGPTASMSAASADTATSSVVEVGNAALLTKNPATGGVVRTMTIWATGAAATADSINIETEWSDYSTGPWRKDAGCAFALVTAALNNQSGSSVLTAKSFASSVSGRYFRARFTNSADAAGIYTVRILISGQ